MQACGTLIMYSSHSSHRDTNELYEVSKSVRVPHALGLLTRKQVLYPLLRNRRTSLGFPIKEGVTLRYVSDDPPKICESGSGNHRRKLQCDRNSNVDAGATKLNGRWMTRAFRKRITTYSHVPIGSNVLIPAHGPLGLDPCPFLCPCHSIGWHCLGVEVTLRVLPVGQQLVLPQSQVDLKHHVVRDPGTLRLGCG